jgi:hypothetical protein
VDWTALKQALGAKLLAVLAPAALMAVLACTPGEAKLLEGVLQNVDSISGETTIKLKDGGTITVNLKDVSVEGLRTAAGSPSLEPGNQVSVQVDKNNAPQKLKAHVAEVEGAIKSLDQAKQTVTIALKKGGEATLQVASDTRIEVEDDKPGAFASLRVGQEIEAKYDVESGKAVKIEVEEEEAKGEAEGTITAIDTTARTIKVRVKGGQEATYKLTPATRLKLNGAGAFDNLKVGTRVEVEFNPVTSELHELAVED